VGRGAVSAIGNTPQPSRTAPVACGANRTPRQSSTAAPGLETQTRFAKSDKSGPDRARGRARSDDSARRV